MSEKLFLPSGATAATGFSLLLVVILTRETSPFAVIVNGPRKQQPGSPALRRVVRVDVDVLDGQVGGPEGTRARPLVKLDADGKFRLRDICVGRGLVENRGPAAIHTNSQVAELDVNAIGVDLGARVADGCNQSAPVGIRARPGGLDERRMRDCFGHAQRFGIAGSALGGQA